MNKFKIYKSIINKSNNSDLEKSYIDMYRKMSIISELLVSESKSHISAQDALSQIKKVIKW